MKLAKVSIAYRAVRDLGALVILLFFSGAASLAASPVAFLVLPVLALFSLAAVVAWEYLVWKNYEFSITRDNFQIRHGVIRKNRREIPLRRIQNVDVRRNLFQRMIGIAKVNLETAGGGESEASLKYVELEQAKEIQKKVRQLKRGAEQEEVETGRELLFELGGTELVLLGFSSFGLQSVLLVLVAFGLFGGLVGQLLGQAGLVTGLSVLLVGTVLVSWVGTALPTIGRYFDFRLYRSRGALEYERGLLNRSEGSIPFEKIQKLEIEENPLQRLLGYATLKIETAGYSGQQSRQAGAEAAIPLARRERVIELGKMVEDFGELSIEGIPARARRRYIGRYILVSLVISMGVVIANQFTSVSYWLLVPLLPVIFVAAHLKWKNIGYGSGRDHFYAMNGFWNRKTMIVPYYRIQNLIESQTVLQRPWDLASLTLDIAGTTRFQRDAVAEDVDAEEARLLREKVYSRFQTSL